MAARTKLIEVALPLDAINRAAAREKSIRHGHPSTLHLWWARRPLAACRAVIFASLIDDPDQPDVPPALLARIDHLPKPDPLPATWTEMTEGERRRHRLFAFIEQLVTWENSTNEDLLREARALIHAATDGTPPPLLDPFCGGGSIPLEAQRLGLAAYASDLNPVAVLITKALIEIPPKFAGRPPVSPDDRRRDSGAAWKGAAGLAADVRSYGRWMRDEAERRIGHLYPKVTLPKEYGGGEATVIAWLWARTVRCPNPACGARMPLVRSFWLSTKSGRQAWVEPVVDRTVNPPEVRFEVKTGAGTLPEGTVNRRGARCIVCGAAVPFDHIRAEGRAGRTGAQMMAIVAEGQRGRMYLPPSDEQAAIAASAVPAWAPETDLPEQALGFRVQLYGMSKHRDLFTPRQLVALTTFSDLVSEARERVRRDAVAAGLPDDGVPLSEGGTGAQAYADAVATYLACALDKLAEASSTICTWSSSPKNELVVSTFRRQAVPMTWDFAEANSFGPSSGSLVGIIDFVAKTVLELPAWRKGAAKQRDATTAVNGVKQPLLSTDPPYYDNVGYADLADFFYVWLRRSMQSIFPELFGTLLTPKEQELVATPYRFGGDKAKADEHVESGLRQAFRHMREAHHPDYPLALFYAFKQAESEKDGESEYPTVASTGWETILAGLLDSGLTITGTWPMRTERAGRSISLGTNALASSIVLVCRPRQEDAPVATRAEFLRALEEELPAALDKLVSGHVAPVDLQQAAIGPGMALFSRYGHVVAADGSPVRVREALALINRQVDAYFREREAEYDPETRWALVWFAQHGFREGLFGDAEILTKAKDTAITTLERAGLVDAGGGRVRLRRPKQFREGYLDDPDRVLTRRTLWGTAMLLAALLDTDGKEAVAAALARLGGGMGMGEIPGLLAELFLIAERAGERAAAGLVNQLAVEWSELLKEATARAQQGQYHLAL